MGIIEYYNGQIILHSHLIVYGSAADPVITENIRQEIEEMWNEPHATVMLERKFLPVNFHITADFVPDITPLDIYANLNPLNNYFRVEEYANGNISFVDGVGCNSGYFKLENLYLGSTTAAHEYGHTLGLDHPPDLDLRGKGQPGIMYPRGTLVDPKFQYDPEKQAGSVGGTMHPQYRKVRQEDIDNLQLQKKPISKGTCLIGDFSNVWHPPHADNKIA